jgi:hypothetical protein
LAILGVEAPGQQGAKKKEYLVISSFRTGSRKGCIGVQNVPLFLSGPFGPRQEMIPHLACLLAQLPRYIQMPFSQGDL